MFLASFLAAAHDGGVFVGNGGQGVLCGPISDPFSMEVLDLFEAGRYYQISPDLGDPDEVCSRPEDCDQCYLQDAFRIAEERAKQALTIDQKIGKTELSALKAYQENKDLSDLFQRVQF